jgi:hypothetical protein
MVVGYGSGACIGRCCDVLLAVISEGSFAVQGRWPVPRTGACFGLEGLAKRMYLAHSRSFPLILAHSLLFLLLGQLVSSVLTAVQIPNLTG